MGDDDKDTYVAYVDIDDLYLDYPEYSDIGTDYAKDMGNITIDTSVFTGNNSTISVTGSGPSGSVLTSNGSSNSWSSYPYSNTSVGGQLDLEGEGADVVINGKSLTKFMETMEKRLAILTPDLEKLEHFAALKKAYDNYKMIEALCEMPAKEQDD